MLLSACKTTNEVQILLQTRKRDAGKFVALTIHEEVTARNRSGDFILD